MNIRALLEERARQYGEKTFLCFGDEQMTYADFYQTVNRTANGFRRLGVRQGDMAAILMPNCPGFLYTWFGLNSLGAVEVPINTAATGDELKYILAHSEAAYAVVHKDCYAAIQGIERADLPSLKNVLVYGGGGSFPDAMSFEALWESNADPIDIVIHDEDPAVCIYTSGTTDRPKGVLNSHKSWVMTGEAYAYTVGISQQDRVMTPNPLFHANAQVYSTMGVLSAGATLILLERFSTSQILEQTRRFGATKLVLVQAMTPWVWSRECREDDANNPVQTLVAGGVPKEIYFDFEKRFGLRVQTIYSLTEAVMGIMGPRTGCGTRKPGGIGKPMEHPDKSVVNEVMLCDDSGKKVVPGAQGEIVIRNPAVMLGYLKNPEKTEETKRNGWIYTGDLGYQDEDGYFFFVGRKKELIRRRGELISPAQIESVINRHPVVRESVVIGLPSGLGTGEEEVFAFVVPKVEGTLPYEELVSHCRSCLSEFKVPRYILSLRELPKNATGRVKRGDLKQIASASEKDCYDRLKV